MNKTDPILKTKLHLPFTRSGLVSRPRLQEQIARGLRGPLTLVTAPAGFGKTTLVASCVTGCGMPAAWLSLDQDDNQAGRFLSYLVAGLQEADPSICAEAAQLVAGLQPAPSEEVLTSILNDLDTIGSGIVLVLDDYQFISSQAVHSSVTFLLEHCPRSFHLVVASRSDPPLPLSRLRARGQMVELRAADLSFTESEAAQFLSDVMGLSLDARSVALLEERTEGWVAGLQMAALSMRDRKDLIAFIEGFSGTNRYILDYLLEEVLASQTLEVQRFLLCTSVLERVSAPLCDAVLADCEIGILLVGDQPGDSPTPQDTSKAMLDYLEKANLFLVSLDDERRWYRYHHLFAELLRARLHQTGPDLVAQLQSRAATWCEHEGLVSEAISYALASQDHGQAASLIEKYWAQAVNSGEIETIWSWLNALPEEVVRRSPSLSLACCWVLWLKAQISAIEPHLVDLEHAIGELSKRGEFNPDDPDYAGMPAHMAVLRSILARYSSDFVTAVASAERALSLIPENLTPQENANLHALIFLALGSAYDGLGDLEKSAQAYAETIRFSSLGANATGVGITIRLIGALRLLGRLREAEQACQDALKYVQDHGISRLPTSGILYLAMSEVLLERDDLEAAESYMSRGMELGKRSGRFDAVFNAAPGLVRLRQARGDLDGALAAVEAAELAHIQPVPPLAQAELLALKAKVLLRKGALSKAAECAEEAAHQAGRDRGQTREIVALAASRVMLAQDKPSEALRELSQSLATAEASGRMGAALEMRILRSLALVRQGDTKGAQADLERALLLAEPEGYVRIFIDEGQPLRLLIAQWLAHASAGPIRDYAARLLSHFEAELPEVRKAQDKSTSTGGLIEPLSQRELEVLHLMALGRTNQEIARQLIVSPGTVKAHSASIYRKLDVANRTEAVARARQLGILP